MEKREPEEDYLSVAEAAAQLETTPTAILMLLRREQLSGRSCSDGWEISSSSVAALQAQRHDEAPLVVCRSSCSDKGCRSCEQPLP